MAVSDGDDRLRRYAADDASACCDVINAAIAAMDGLNAARRFVRAKNIAAAFDAEVRDWYTLIYEKDGCCLGLGALDGNEVRRLYVRPQAQAHGVGDALMTMLEEEARRRGMDRVVVEASPSSISFYMQRGYVPEAEQTVAIGDAEFRFVPMHKELRTQQ